MTGATLCPNCNKTAQTDLQKSVACDGCRKYVHLACIQLTRDDVNRFTRLQARAVKIYCKSCTSEVDTISSLKQLILTLQADLLELKTNFKPAQPTEVVSLDIETVINEINDRTRRESHVILSGVPETGDLNSKVVEILEKLAPNAPVQSLQAHRIGSSQNASNSRPRLVKVKLCNSDVARTIIRNASKARNFPELNNIYINPDRTPMQQQYFKKIRSELQSRISNGESNLRITYNNGIPSITMKKN